MITQQYLTDLTYKINGACIEVHKILGAGLAEVVYHKALEEEFKLRNLNFKSEFQIPVFYKEKKLDWKVVSGSAASDKIAFPFKKDAQGKKLQKQFNKELKKMASDGTLTKISKKYYGYDTTK